MVQPELLLAQLEAIFSGPSTCCLGEEADPYLATVSFQVVIESSKVSPEKDNILHEQNTLVQCLLPKSCLAV